MTTYAYDAVLNAPDTATRKDALDRYRIEVLAEGMDKAAHIVYHHESGYWRDLVDAIRKAAEDLEGT